MHPVTYIYKTVGDCSIKADVYLPPARTTCRATIVYIHGGGMICGSRKWFLGKQRDMYLKAGYGIVSIDYRLAPETRLPEIIEDLQDAFR